MNAIDNATQTGLRPAEAFHADFGYWPLPSGLNSDQRFWDRLSWDQVEGVKANADRIRSMFPDVFA
jgi:hypothetical protein